MQENELTEIICSNIKFYRTKRHLTQAKFAELTGLSPNFISNLEAGRSMVALDTLMIICQVLGVTPNDILLEKSDMEIEAYDSVEELAEKTLAVFCSRFTSEVVKLFDGEKSGSEVKYNSSVRPRPEKLNIADSKKSK